MLHDLLMFFAATYARMFDMTLGPPLHDPLAVAALMPEEFGMEFEFEEGSIEVVLHGEEIGRTIMRRPEEMADANRHEGLEVLKDGEEEGQVVGVKVKVGRRVNVRKFWEVIMGVVGSADGVSPLNV